VRDLCQIYGLGPAETDHLMTMAREARQGGWWQDYDHRDFRLYLGLEAEASSITYYETCAVPGILQTREYARAILRGVLPEIKEDVLAERVDARMRRQDLLNRRTPPHHWILMDESVLHRHVGGARVMHDQLLQVREACELPHVTIQVIPFSVGAHVGFNTSFTLLEVFDPGVPDIVHVEAVTRMEYLEKPSDLTRYRTAIEHLKVAGLDPRASAARISEVNQKVAN
jgi:hypothetical protein